MLSKDCVCTSSDETFYRIQSKRNTQNKALDLSGAFSLSFFAFSTRIRFRRDVWMSFYDVGDFPSISPRLAIKNSETDEISRISEIIYDKLRLRGVSFEFWNFINAKFIFLLFYEIRAKWQRPRNHLLMLLVLCDEALKSTAGLPESPSTSSRIYYSVFIGPRCGVTTFPHVGVSR